MMQKILIIEDNEKNRRLMRDVLQHHGYEILEAEDGDEGVRIAREKKPSLILLDMQMPVLDGFASARLLKSDPATRRIPIIAITSLAMTGDRERVMAAGADAYLAKPIDTRVLPKSVRELLS